MPLLEFLVNMVQLNNFLQFLGIGRTQILFTDLSFILVASYISIPFMVLPIFNALNDLDDNLVNASADLGASRFQLLLK